MALLDDFLLNNTDPVVLLLKIALFLVVFFLYYWLFVKSPLKVLNNAFFNGLAIVFLGYLLFRLSPVALYIVGGLALVLILYKYLIKGGDFSFDTTGGTFGDSRWSKFNELKKRD